MNLNKIAICVSLCIPMSAFAQYMVSIPLTQDLKGHLPDNSITFTDNPGNNGGNGGNGNGDNGGGSTPEDDIILSTSGSGNSCAYNNSNYVLEERTINGYIYEYMYEWKSTHFSVPVTRGNASNSVLNYNGKTYDLSWPEIKSVITGSGESEILKKYYKICESKNSGG